MRLFVAVDLPRSVADRVAAMDRPPRPGVRWTTPDQWHVTMRFLGESPPDEVIAASRSGAEGTEPWNLVASLGPASAWFPGRRVLQIPVSGLDRLAEVVRRVTLPWGRADDQPFNGHLTLARTVGGRRGPVDLGGAIVSARFAVTEFGVYSSRTDPGGAVYERLATIPLGAARG